MKFLRDIAAVAATVGAIALALPSAALADESWSNGEIDVIWESDMADGAVFAATETASGAQGRIFVKGLTADAAERGTYKAIWVVYDEEQVCDEPLTDPTGAETWNWGTMLITFTSPEFPYSWDAKVGTCKGPQNDEISMSPPGG
jgi:hypothetical protein